MDNETNKGETNKIIKNQDSTVIVSDDEVPQQVPARCSRRSSIFNFSTEANAAVDIPNTSEIQYPPDYFQKLQEEEQQWKTHAASLKNEIFELKKSLQDPKTVVPLTILDKEQQEFFKDVPALYSKYLEEATEHCENVEAMAVIYGNMLTYTREVTTKMEPLLMHTEEQLQHLLRDMY